MFAELDGVALDVQAPVTWGETPGVAPYQTFLELDRSVADALFAGARQHSSILRYEANGKEVVRKGLTILGLSPTASAHTQKLQLSDRRWTWIYPFVPGAYNVPRKSPQNSQRIVAAAQGLANLPPELAVGLRIQTDDRVYAQWSLRPNGSAWTADQVIEDVLRQLVGADWRWQGREAIRMGEVEGLVLASQGGTALQQVFGHVGGGVSCYVDRDAQVVIYSPQDGSELEVVGLDANRTVTAATAVRPVVGRPLRELQDNSMVRPRAYRILFDRLIEGRVDFTEGADAATTTGTRGDPVVTPTAFNVFPAPEDGIVTAVGDRRPRQVVKGTWLTLSDLLNLYANDAKSNQLASKLPLTEEVIEKLWFSNGLAAYSHPSYDRGRAWDRRIAVIREHWRRTYQIQRPWVDRILSIQPYRVALEDAESGARAPAMVYQDYSVVFSWDPNSTGHLPSDDELDLVKTKVANPANFPAGGGIVGTALASLDNAPATVRVLDEEQGIVQVDFQSDWTGWSDRYERTASVPLSSARAAYAERKILLQDDAASPEHEVSLLLSFAMGAPTDARRFYAVEITAAQAAELLPRPGLVGNLEGKGPVLEIHFGAPRLAARFAWRDDRAQQFAELFSGGFQGALPDVGDPVNLAQLATVARSVAAREASRFTNRAEGALTTDLDPAAHVTGAISAVVHELEAGPQGGALTTIELDPQPPPLDPRATMPADVRRVVDGWVDR